MRFLRVLSGYFKNNIIGDVNMMNLGISNILATGIADAVLNVLAIIGIVCLGAFIIVFICDLILSISGNKNGIFFKRKETIYEKEQDRVQSNDLNLNRVEENSFYNERVSALEAKQNAYDEEKALQEERELREKLAYNRERELDAMVNSTVVNDALVEKEREQDDRLDDLESKNAELIRLLEEKDESVNNVEESRDEVVESSASTFLDDVEDEEDDYDDIIAAINRMKEAEEQASQNVVESEEESVIEEETIVEEEYISEEEMGEDVLDVQATEEDIVQPTVEETVIAEDLKDDEYYKTLSKEIEDLKKELEEQKRIMENDKVEAQEREEELRKQNAQLAEELEDAKQIQDTTENEVTPLMLTEQEYNDRLAVLRERLKENDKQLRRIKKEYKPLEKVSRTLERDKEKLRRREAIVAKQKIVLYGVNNYIDIDEEKAQKLAEDLDLLDGLRLSVQHCEEVMEANKDRFPILEQTYNILVTNSEQINSDIKQVEEDLAKLKASEENGEDDAHQEMAMADASAEVVASEEEVAVNAEENATENVQELNVVESEEVVASEGENEGIMTLENVVEDEAVSMQGEENATEDSVNEGNADLHFGNSEEGEEIDQYLEGEVVTLQDQITFEDIQREVEGAVNGTDANSVMDIRFDDETDTNNNK